MRKDWFDYVESEIEKRRANEVWQATHLQMGCYGCKFAIKKRLGQSLCCSYGFKITVIDGKCNRARKE